MNWERILVWYKTPNKNSINVEIEFGNRNVLWIVFPCVFSPPLSLFLAHNIVFSFIFAFYLVFTKQKKYRESWTQKWIYSTVRKSNRSKERKSRMRMTFVNDFHRKKHVCKISIPIQINLFHMFLLSKNRYGVRISHVKIFHIRRIIS